MFEPNTAEMVWITMMVTCASVTSMRPKRSVPDTYVCQWAQ